MANLCPGLIWSLLWLVGLLFLAWPIGFLVAWIYVLLLPFSACCSPCKDLCNSVLSLVQLPLTFTENMMNMKPCCT